jgi:hypothetical protein
MTNFARAFFVWIRMSGTIPSSITKMIEIAVASMFALIWAQRPGVEEELLLLVLVPSSLSVGI